VVSNWGANISGYWGSNSNNIIRQQVLNVIQAHPVEVGMNINPILTSGNKASEAATLDERASQDIDTTHNTVSAYLAATHNGRRLLPAPIVNPVDPTHTNVLGYGQFLLVANGPITTRRTPTAMIRTVPSTLGPITSAAPVRGREALPAPLE
jgi:hypothetical protein